MRHGVLKGKNSIQTSINPFHNLYCTLGARLLKLTWHICSTVSAYDLFFHRLDALSFMNAGSIPCFSLPGATYSRAMLFTAGAQCPLQV
jgi:hypothetical protein